MTEDAARTFASIKKDTDARLAKFFVEQTKLAGKVDAGYKRLIGDISKQVTTGGKRIRPYFTWLGYKSAGGSDEEVVARLGLAMELYHNYLLLHDDVIDRDDRRHGKLNVVGMARKRLVKSSPTVIEHIASGLGILAGDVLHGFSTSVLSELLIDDDTKMRLFRGFEKLNFEVVAGQQMDMMISLEKEVVLKKILKMYQYKTATCTVICPLEMGAILAGANDRILGILREYGSKVGIAFQLADDILGMFGSSKVIGKSVVSDLREAKKTALMHYGLKFATDTDRKVLLAKLGDPAVTMADLKLVRKILSDCGAKAKTIFLAQQHIDQAKKCLNKIEFPGGIKTHLISVADFVINRDK